MSERIGSLNEEVSRLKAKRLQSIVAGRAAVLSWNKPTYPPVVKSVPMWY